MKKLISTLLLVSLVLSTAASCGSNTGSETPVSGDTITSAATDSSEVEDDAGTEEEVLRPNLPDNNYGGHDFTVMVSFNDETSGLKNDFKADEETGEIINDERYRRNKIVEERFNVNIKTIEYPGTDSNVSYNNLKRSVMANDYSYDAAMIAGYAACKLASEGYLYDLNSFQYLNLENPWWDQKANLDLAIKGKMFYTTGDISIVNNDATYCILFNKTMVKNYGIEDLYQVVKDGKWTMDKFIEVASMIPPDVNGTGIYDTNNTYGALIWDDSMMGIVNAAGEKCAIINDEGEIELTLYNDKVLSMFEKFTSYVFDKSRAHAYQRANWDGIASNNMFSGNQSLFYLQLLRLVTDLRGMVDDFGVLPYPKYDEKQEEYYSTVGSWHSAFLSAPATQEDPERTGIILEALASESRYTVKPAYYDVALKGKYARDDESSDMLDIILSTRTYDVGWYYAIGSYNEEVMNLFRNFKSDFTSMYEKRENSAIKAIEKLNAKFDEILD